MTEKFIDSATIMAVYPHLTVLTSYLQELVAIREMIMGHVDVSALLIIITRVVGAPSYSRPLLGVGPHKVDVRVRLDLRLLQGGQL